MDLSFYVSKLIENDELTSNFPRSLDFNHYRNANADLSTMRDNELINHFEEWGRKEGRAGAAQSFREYFIPLISTELETLEIGPFCGPLLRGDNVRYFDIADRDTLIERANQLRYEFTDAPIIDYVSPIGDLSIINDSFDQVFSAHCIEHQPNFIAHLKEVSRLLRPNGSYFLIVPDKRYCFDYYLSETNLADILGAYYEDKKIHYAKSVLEHKLLTTHNDPIRHWQGDHGNQAYHIENQVDLPHVCDEMLKHKDTYLDTHAWHFTPEGFVEIMTNLLELKFTDMVAERVYNTPYGRFEFCVILTKKS